MNIRSAITDSEILACYPAMRELRPHTAEDQFLSRVRNQAKPAIGFCLSKSRMVWSLSQGSGWEKTWRGVASCTSTTL